VVLRGRRSSRTSAAWARGQNRGLLYVLLGSAEYEGVPGDQIANERHVGAFALRVASSRIAERVDCQPDVRALAKGYSRWLDAHVAERERKAAAPAGEWGRLEYAVFYDRVRATVGWKASIYPSNNPGGPVYILHFHQDLPLNDRRVGSAGLYWELVNGVVRFKMRAIPQHARADGALSVRAELRQLLARAAKAHGIDVVVSGRQGEYMSIARAVFDLRSLSTRTSLDVSRAREHLMACRSVHEAVARAWRASAA
jgi:hypothetical protein